MEQQLQGRNTDFEQTELLESDSEETKSDSHSQHNDEEEGKNDNENVENENQCNIQVEKEKCEQNKNFETAEKTIPAEQSSEIRKNVSVEVSPPNFDFGITQIIKKIQEERKSVEQEGKKMPSEDEPPSYVDRIKKRERKKTIRRDSFDYPTISKKKRKKTSIEAGKNREDQPTEESEKEKKQ